jgi:hypothetical protein
VELPLQFISLGMNSNNVELFEGMELADPRLGEVPLRFAFAKTWSEWHKRMPFRKLQLNLQINNANV